MDKIIVNITDGNGILVRQVILPIGTHNHSPGETINDAAEYVAELIESHCESEIDQEG